MASAELPGPASVAMPPEAASSIGFIALAAVLATIVPRWRSDAAKRAGSELADIEADR